MNAIETAQPAILDPREGRALAFGKESRRRTFTDIRALVAEHLAGAGREAEARALVSGGTGVNTAPDLVSALVDGGRLAPLCHVVKMPNAETVVPIFGTMLALPVGSVPGATGTGSDSTGVLSSKTMVLKPWYSTLSVSRGAMLSLDFAQKFPALAAKVFGASIDKGILMGTGTGSDMLGVFVESLDGVTSASNVNAAATGAPKLIDLVGLASTILAAGADPATSAIVIAPSLLKALYYETTSGYEAVRMELALKGTILGLRVIPSSYCPTSTAAGSMMAVVGDFASYTLAVAADLRIDEILRAGCDDVTLQSYMYMQGNPSIGASFRRLIAV